MKIGNQKAMPAGRQGFTLIELLVVIALIGILMAIVVVGINPAARIDDAEDAQAQANVRSVASGMEACITDNLGDTTACDTVAKLEAGYVTKVPAAVTISDGCVEQEGRNSSTIWYFDHDVGVVTSGAVACP